MRAICDPACGILPAGAASSDRSLYDWIAHESGFPNRAEAYVTALMDRCDALADFPMVGRARDDIRPGLRTIGFRRRTVIAFAITDEMIEIIGVYYGGRDYGPLLRADDE